MRQGASLNAALLHVLALHVLVEIAPHRVALLAELAAEALLSVDARNVQIKRRLGSILTVAALSDASDRPMHGKKGRERLTEYSQ